MPFSQCLPYGKTDYLKMTAMQFSILMIFPKNYGMSIRGFLLGTKVFFVGQSKSNHLSPEAILWIHDYRE
jgi:hypothetical protein